MGKAYVRATNFKTCYVNNKSLFSLKVIQQSNGGIIICGENQYTIVNSNRTFHRCLPCAKYHKGYGLYPACGSKLFDPPTTECRACKIGAFSSEYDSSSYRACHHDQCAENQIKTV